MDHATFMRAICAAPADDGPRLVYADWLEEQGDGERAEFIRVQVERDRLPSVFGPCDCYEFGADHPTVAKRLTKCAYHKRLDFLRRRERELLDAHGCTWVRPFVEILGVIGEPFGDISLGGGRVFWIWHRGFIDSITLSWPDWLAHHAAIRAAQPVTKVRLTTIPTAQHLTGPYGRGESIRFRLTGLSREGCITDAEVMAETWDQMMPRKLAELLAAEWPGIAFELPAAQQTHACDHCGTTEEVTFAPNPYAHEIHDDDTPVWMCGSCRYEAAMDI